MDDRTGEAQAKGQPREGQTVRFHYAKAPDFRTIHVDGGVGGLTPRGSIQLTVYAERRPIPTQTEFELRPDGTLGTEVEESRIGKDGILREMQCSLVMDHVTARAIRDWLGARLGELERLEGEEKQQ